VIIIFSIGKKKKITAWLLVLLLTLSTVFPNAFINVKADAAGKTFDIIEVTDFHGALEDSSNPPLPSGAVLAKNIKDIKASNPDRTLVLGGGDLYQGTPVSNVLFGVPVQKLMDNIGMEVTALGNHEFDWGLDKITGTTMKDAKYSIVCSNLYRKDTKQRVFEPYKIIEKDGVKIAVVGAITTETPNIVMPAYVKDYNFTDPAEEINSVAKDLKESKKADVVLAVVHEGNDASAPATGPIFDIANSLTNVDAVLGGHSHTILQATVKGMPVVIGGAQSKGFIDLKMNIDEAGKISFTNTDNSYIAINTNAPNGYKAADPAVDSEAASIVAEAKNEIGPTFSEVIGTVKDDVTRAQVQQPYGESELGNWAADVVRNYAKADVGVANNGGLRIDIPAGNVTVGQIYTLMPFDNEINTVSMNKAQLKTVLEQAVGTYPDPSNAKNTLGGKGIQISGIKFTYDDSRAYGSKVTSITREDGSAISDTETLKVAGPDFVLTGGDGFLGFTDSEVKKTLSNTHELARDAFIEDIRANKTIKYAIENRIVSQNQTGEGESMTIAEARKAQTGSVILTGTVSVVNGKSVFMQDDTAGICVYNEKGSAIHKGDKITVKGTLSDFYGLLEITPSSAEDVKVESTGNTVTPKEVTADKLNGDLQGQLVKIKGLTFESIDNSGASMAHDSTGSVNIYKMPKVDGLAVNDTADVTGAVSKYGSSIELLVGSAADVVKTGSTQEPAAAISILGTSDIHGNIFPIDYSTLKESDQGLAKVSTYVNSVRASNPNTMLIDNGDTIQGTPLSYYYDKIDTTTEYPLIKVMGAMKYDSWTLGNHEFNYGLDVLNRIIADAQKEKINVLSANTYKTSDNTNFVKPYITKTFNVNGKDVKVGILGLTTKTIPNWENTDNYRGLQFNDLVDEAKKWVPVLRNTEKADVVILSVHSGEESATDTIPENQVKAIATGVDGIDAILCGHVHANISSDTSLKNPSGKVVPITEPGKWGQYVSKLDINFNADGTPNVTTKTVKMDSSIQADPAILKLAQPYEDATLKYISTVIGQSTGDFSGEKQTTEPTALMDLINKVQADAAGTQLSIAAPLSASAHIPSGNIKIQDIMGVYVFENFLYGIKMNGAQLKRWLEYSVRYYKQVSDTDKSVVKDPVLNIPDYNLDQLYGATYDIDLTQPACTVDPNTGIVNSENRIKNLKFNGKPVSDTDEFTVAINNYRYNGGGGFMKAAGLTVKNEEGKDVPDDSKVMYDSAKALGDDGQVRNMMIKYIQDNKTITPDVSNNWSVITTPGSEPNKDFSIENLTKTTSFKPGNDAEVRVKVTNNLNTAKTVTLIEALFQNNKFINYVKCSQDLESNKSIILDGGFTIPNDDGYSVKAMLWDTLDNGKPISDYIEIPVAN
jgi:2',3'-cyclic-nucleotide 2'-phosphodiesterase/3'-nucleotidase